MTHVYDIACLVCSSLTFVVLCVAIRRHDARMNVRRYIRTRVANVDRAYNDVSHARNRVGDN